MTGKVKDEVTTGATELDVMYEITDTQATWSPCRVGAMPTTNTFYHTAGCFDHTQGISVPSLTLNISPSAMEHKNKYYIAKFSTDADKKMILAPDATPVAGCKGCPYKDAMMYKNYYGSSTYADDWVSAALAGTATQFTNGNADFATVNDVLTRKECAKKGSAYMNTWMYVVREMEDAIDDCQTDCANTLSCNDDPVHAWDEAVAFYTGSLEGEDGKGLNSPAFSGVTPGSGKMIYALADKRCANFKTCGPAGDGLPPPTPRNSKVTLAIFTAFPIAQNKL